MQYTKNLEPNIVYPQNSEYITSHVDMEKAYEAFSKTYNIPRDTFILTKGTEEAINICFKVLEWIRKNNYGTSMPGLLFADSDYIPTNSASIKDINYSLFDWDTRIKNFYEFNEDLGWLSHTHYSEFKEELPNNFNIFVTPTLYNSLHTIPVAFIEDDYFKYFTDKEFDRPIFSYAYTSVDYWKDKDIDIPWSGDIYENIIPNNYIVEDDSFTNNNLLAWSSICDNGNIDKYKFRFVIGSYDIPIGFGVQLGYILYYPKYNFIFDLFKPTFISPLAAMHCKVKIPNFDLRMDNTILKIKEQEPKFEPEILKEGKYVDIHPNFITMKKEDYTGPEERIDIEFEDPYSKTKFVRLGMIKE